MNTERLPPSPPAFTQAIELVARNLQKIDVSEPKGIFGVKIAKLYQGLTNAINQLVHRLQTGEWLISGSLKTLKNEVVQLRSETEKSLVRNEKDLGMVEADQWMRTECQGRIKKIENILGLVIDRLGRGDREELNEILQDISDLAELNENYLSVDKEILPSLRSARGTAYAEELYGQVKGREKKLAAEDKAKEHEQFEVARNAFTQELEKRKQQKVVARDEDVERLEKELGFDKRSQQGMEAEDVFASWEKETDKKFETRAEAGKKTKVENKARELKKSKLEQIKARELEKVQNKSDKELKEDIGSKLNRLIIDSYKKDGFLGALRSTSGSSEEKSKDNLTLMAIRDKKYDYGAVSDKELIQDVESAIALIEKAARNAKTTISQETQRKIDELRTFSRILKNRKA